LVVLNIISFWKLFFNLFCQLSIVT